jgi:hypothetical protein
MLAEAEAPPVETHRRSSAERGFRGFVDERKAPVEFRHVNASKKPGKEIPPAVISEDPRPGLEEKLRRNPDDQDAKADVGSDESMDASDPPAAAQPGTKDEPVPSSGFPEDEEKPKRRS